VKIFNQEKVDELMLLEIDFSKDGRRSDFEVVRNIAVEPRTPSITVVVLKPLNRQRRLSL
jgi:imidazole glycerol phosphate synthase subunit HisF